MRLYLSEVLNISYSLLSQAELRDGITKQLSTYVLPTQLPAQYEILTAFRSCKRVTLQGCYAVSDILLSLAFATRWNPKHSSYVSTWLFCNSVVFRLFCQYSVVCCVSIPVFRRCSVFRSSGVPVCLSNCLCSSSSCFSASVTQNIGKFGTKSYFTDHQRANTINSFTDLVPVLKTYNCS